MARRRRSQGLAGITAGLVVRRDRGHLGRPPRGLPLDDVTVVVDPMLLLLSSSNLVGLEPLMRMRWMPRDVALQAPHRFTSGLAFADAPFDIARVVGSQRSRTDTIRHTAMLASRLPPRLSRCRCCLPEDASSGDTPQGAATEASDLSRSGLSPAAIINATANVRSDALLFEQPFEGGERDGRLERRPESGRLNVEMSPPPSETEHRHAVPVDSLDETDEEQLHHLCDRLTGKTLTKFIGRGHDQCVGLVRRHVTGLDRGAARRNDRMASTGPSTNFGVMRSSPASAVLATSASTASDLPRRRRAAGSAGTPRAPSPQRQ